MSFVERNRIWLLPVLGVVLVGVVGLNLRARPAARPPGAGGAPPVGRPPVPHGDPGDPAAPPASLQDIGGLLAAGLHPLAEGLRDGPRPASLHPDLCRALPGPLAPAGPDPAGGAVRGGPPPGLEFIIDRGQGAEAWVGGRPFRPGDRLEGGYRVRRVTLAGMVVAGPGGVVVCPLDRPRVVPS